MVIRVPDQRNSPGGYAVLDDRLLVLDFQAGNPQAFVEIHRRYGALARHVCQRFLSNQQDTDEAFQETMIRVFQGLYRFNGRYALQPWVARIAKNVSLDHLRGRARRPQADDAAPSSDELPIPGDQADEIVERLVQRDTVLTVLADLPETHRRALMLRELEGCSHREVAQEMDITTSQAKALIHRAKGSFRRRWLEKVAERGGFMGIAFVPLLWLVHLGNALRRLGDRAGHAAQAAQMAAPEAVSTTVTATAAPAASGVGERLVAAGMTLLLAGGVSVGAAKIVHDRAEPESVTQAVAQVASVAQAPPVSRDRRDPPAEDRLQAARDTTDIKAEPPIVVEPEPSPEPETSPAPEPVTEPPPEPSPEPSPTPPPPPPVPDWSFDVTSSTTSVESCSCSADGELVASQDDGAPDDLFTFSQAIRGGARDAVGDLTWPFALQQWGEIRPSGGRLEYRLMLSSGSGKYLYGGTAALAEVTEIPDGGTVYRFEGTFDLTKASQPVAGLPWRGFVSATIRVWSDGTIYGGSLALEDASA
jgi:RNA polymerase sigma-70 factor, ECF subfamily